MTRTKGMTWQGRHYVVRTRTVDPHPVAAMLDAVTEAVNSYPEDRWPDANTSRGYGEILEGILVLLNEDLGGMDGGTLWSEVAELAERIGWDLDLSEVRWEA